MKYLLCVLFLTLGLNNVLAAELEQVVDRKTEKLGTISELSLEVKNTHYDSVSIRITSELGSCHLIYKDGKEDAGLKLYNLLKSAHKIICTKHLVGGNLRAYTVTIKN